MLRKNLAVLSVVTLLASCAHAPSPQTTSPSQEAQCAALRSEMLDAPMTDNTTPVAIAQGQNMANQQLYHNECEK